jgi:threonine dehydrogenase-like Zn-dependent dehydrogenase
VKALTFRGKRTIAVESVPDPEIVQPTDAIVRVRLAGICGSDLHPYHEREQGLDHGTVMGHEFVGEIVDVGSGVTGLKKGQTVLSPFTTSCGACFFCRSGLTARCESSQLFGWKSDGQGLDGGQAELVRVPLADGTLVALPDGVGDVEGLLLGDVMSTGYYCARCADLQAGSNCVVVGCGPVGLMAVVGARERGAERVWAIDAIPERLALARKFGAEPLDLADDPAAAVREATDGRGADAVLEAVGSPAAGKLAVELVRPGGTVSIVGVHNEAHFPLSPNDAYDLNLTLRIGRCPARAMLEELIPVVRAGRHDVASIVTHRRTLDDGPEAYVQFDRKQDGCIKVVLET